MNGIDSMSPASEKRFLASQTVKHLMLAHMDTFHQHSVMSGLCENLPIVPPNSMTQTSAGPSFPSTGIIAARSIHS